MTHLTKRIVKAVRKKHQCVWCLEPIDKGDPAVYRVYIFDSDFKADYMHPECHTAMSSSKEPGWEYVMARITSDGFEEGEFKRGSIELKYP